MKNLAYLFISLFIFCMLFMGLAQDVFCMSSQEEMLIKEYLYEEGIKCYGIEDVNSAKKAFDEIVKLDPSYRDTNEYLQKIERLSRAKQIDLPVNVLPSNDARRAQAKGSDLSPGVAVIDLSKTSISAKISITIDESKELLVSNLDKFLNTNPSLLSVKKVSDNKLEVTGLAVGTVFVLIWDKAGARYSRGFDVKQKPLTVTTVEKQYYQEIQEAGSLKFDFMYDDDVLSTGPKPRGVRKGSHSYDYTASLYGDTAIGRLNSGLLVKGIGNSSMLNKFWIQSLNSKLGPFDNFDIRGGDTDVAVPDLSLPSASFRGVRFDKYSDDKKINSIFFWGEERYYFLFPGLGIKRNLLSYLYGTTVSFPVKDINLRTSYFGAYGEDRKSYQASKNASVQGKFKLANLDWLAEANFDGEDRAFLLKSAINRQTYRLSGAFRNVAKNYATLIGAAPNQGERGFLFTGAFRPTERIRLDSRFDIYQDRIFPRPNNPDLPNVDININGSVNPFGNFIANFDYNNMNDRGKLFPIIFDVTGVTLRDKFKIIKEFYPYVRYQNQKNVNLTSPTSDFINNKILVGTQMNIMPGLSLDVSKEWNWLKATYFGERSYPASLTAELYYDVNIKNTPFRFKNRFRYVKEDNAESQLSFLSGQNIREDQAELIYRPNNNIEGYLNVRATDYTAVVSRNTNRFELEVKSGFRGTFDTGFKFQPKCDIDGAVFLDSNGDGIMQDDEPFIERIGIIMGKRKILTGSDGCFGFKKVRGRIAYVSVDTATLPSGHLVTTPLKQTVNIVDGITANVYFGVAAVSEIWGLVYNDVNKDFQMNTDEAGLMGVSVILDGRTKITTDKFGRYRLVDIVPGAHEVKIDLNSVAIGYLPQGPIIKTLEIKEGDRAKVDFAFNANRTLSGMVFFDSNKNGVYDYLDIGIKGVKILLDGQTALSDKEGKFLFKSIKPGNYVLTMDITTIPKEYAMAGDYSKPISIPIEPVKLERINFCLDKMRT